MMTITYAQEADYSLLPGEFMIFEPEADIYIPYGCYHCSSEKYLIGIRIDSSTNSADSSIFYLSKDIMEQEFPCYNLGPSVMGSIIVERMNGQSVCYTMQQEEITITRSLGLGESSLFYTCSNGNYITSTVVLHEPEAFLGIIDSVKVFSLQMHESSGNPSENQINNYIVKLSKNHGLIQFFNIRDFPGAVDGTFYVSRS
ncbi:MAG: hypothetical protein ABFS10_12215 [Bacteroidota bacterium]